MATAMESVNSSSSHDGATATTDNNPPDSVQEQIRQLNDARKLVLANVSYYPTIVQGILPIISPSSRPELRRWGADFLAEAFAAPALGLREKENLSLLVLESLRGMLDKAGEDVFVLRSIIQAAASIYPMIMRWIINNSFDTPTWERLGAIKSRILRLWETAAPSVQVCCIKFAQRVVLAQTHSASSEPGRRSGSLDISLSMVPAEHALLDARRLEAEATGLLDRMLGVLQENSGNALIVDATLNTLSVLVRTRPTTVNRTINAVLSFNPFKLAASGSGSLTARTRVLVRSMEKTTRMLLMHLSKRDPHNAFAGRIQQYLERLARTRAELAEDGGRAGKRELADAAAAVYGDAKRARMGEQPQQQQQELQLRQQQAPQQQPQQPWQIPPLAPGVRHSLADIFTLSAPEGPLRRFYGPQVPVDVAARISVAALARVAPAVLAQAMEGIRGRLAAMEAEANGEDGDEGEGGKTRSSSGSFANEGGSSYLGSGDGGDGNGDDDDDDYEPDFSTAEDTEQILNKLDGEGGGGSGPTPAQVQQQVDAVVAAAGGGLMVTGGGGGSGGSGDGAGAARGTTSASLGLGGIGFRLPVAPRLTAEQAVTVGEATVARVFGVMQQSADETEGGAAATAAAVPGAGRGVGLNRVAASAFDRDAWITILTRLATRAVAPERGGEGGDGEDEEEEGEEEDEEEEGEEEEEDDDDDDEDGYDVETGEAIPKKARRKKPEKKAAEKPEKKAEKPETETHSPKDGRRVALNEAVRAALFRYIMEDFRRRIDVAVAWLCEEWYSEKVGVLSSAGAGSGVSPGGSGSGSGNSGTAPGGAGSTTSTPTAYHYWVVRILDGFLPYLHAQDTKVLTRFLSEVPALNASLLQRVKSLCRDPSMVPVALTSLLYQLMMRPPARGLTLDTMEEIWVEFEDARPMATKYLDKWRPGFVQKHMAAAAGGAGEKLD